MEEWRKKPAAAGEPHEKTVGGEVCKWCGKCFQGKGLWTIKDHAHSTSEHHTRKELKEQKEQGKLAVIPSTPLEVHIG